MKNTPFLQPHRSSRRFIVAPLTVLCILVALVIAGTSPAWLERGLLALATPLWKARAVLAQGVVDVSGRFRSREEVDAENKELREANTALRIKGALYDELSADVARLEAMLGRVPPSSPVLLGYIIASPTASPHDSFMIDVGSAHGVAVGDIVSFDGTLVLGRVDLVAPHASRVLLSSAAGMTHDVSVGTSSSRFKAEGQGGGMFVLRVPNDITVDENDALMLSGTHRAIGFVRDTEARDTDAFTTVYAVMPLNLFETREVVVIPSSPRQ